MAFIHTGKEDIVGFYKPQLDLFVEQIHKAIEKYNQVTDKIKNLSKYTWQSVVLPIDEATEKIFRIWSLIAHLNAVDNTPEIRAIHDTLLPIIMDFQTSVMQDEQLYNIYQQIYQSPEFEGLTGSKKAVVINALRDFKLSGVTLPSEQRATFKKLAEHISKLENSFSTNVVDATDGWTYYLAPEQRTLLEGLSDHTIESASTRAANKNKPGWLFTLDLTCYESVLGYAKNRDLRKIFYTAFMTRASDQGPNSSKWDNTSVIYQLLENRQQLAMMLGYPNFAEYSLVPKMANSAKVVNKFLLALSKRIKPKADQEFTKLQNFAKQQGLEDELEPWDEMYYRELYKESHFAISEEMLREYFPVTQVLTGMFNLVQKIFGITIDEIYDFDTWHKSVRMFKVIDQQNQLRGYFYLDLYTRDHKRDGGWMQGCVDRLQFVNGDLQLPVAYLVCNYAPPLSDKPSLLAHTDVVYLFHEFGHVLHHVLTKMDYYGISGINGVERDMSEFPSQFMEKWCWEWPVICDISKNIHTGESLPQVLFNGLLASKNAFSAMFLLWRIEISLFDIRAHESLAIDLTHSAHEIMQDIYNEFAVMPMPNFVRFENSFRHIFSDSFAAGVYSYLWADVFACDAFDKFRANGLYSAKIGKKFMENILEQGGSKPAKELYVEFAGHEPKLDAILRHNAI